MTKAEQMKAREDLDKVLKEQFEKALEVLSECDATAIATGQAARVFGYLRTVAEGFGVPEHRLGFLPAEWEGYSFEEPVKDEPTEESPVKPAPVVTIEDLAAAETKAVLGETGEPAAKAEEPAPSYTKQEVVNILTGLNKKYGDDAEIIPAALSKFGCSKLSEMPEEKYGELIAAAKEIAGES